MGGRVPGLNGQGKSFNDLAVEIQHFLIISKGLFQGNGPLFPKGGEQFEFLFIQAAVSGEIDGQKTGIGAGDIKIEPGN